MNLCRLTEAHLWAVSAETQVSLIHRSNSMFVKSRGAICGGLWQAEHRERMELAVGRNVSLPMILLIWAIGAIVPLVILLSSEFGKNDFVVLWIAGSQVLAGDARGVYDVAATGVFADQFDLGKATIFPYPPHALFLFVPFALLRYHAAYVVWTVVTAAFFCWSAKPYIGGKLPLALAVLTPAAITCIAFGQTGLVFGGLWLLAFRGKWPAVAALTFKPHLGILSILSLRNRSALAGTIALTVALLGASAVLLGWSLWPSFFEHSFGHVARITSMKRWLFAGVTPAIGYGFIGWLPFAVAGALLLARNVNAFTAATASFLISPYGFNYDLPVVSLGFGLLLYRNWVNMPFRHRLPIALGFIVPVIAMAGAWWAPPILLWALWVQVQYGTGAFDGGRSEIGPRVERWRAQRFLR